MPWLGFSLFVSFVFFVVSKCFGKARWNHEGHEGHKEMKKREAEIGSGFAAV
jgi:hypothetical protein